MATPMPARTGGGGVGSGLVSAMDAGFLRHGQHNTLWDRPPSLIGRRRPGL